MTAFTRRQVRRLKPPHPKLVAALLTTFGQRTSVVDLGAGSGALVRILRECGNEAVGYDLSDAADGDAVLRWDCTTPVPIVAEWTVSIEVGEHLRHADCYGLLDNLARAATGSVITWATPGVPGRGHINCQPVEWVVEQMERRGMRFDRLATRRARRLCSRHFRRRLIVCRRRR